jgi:hypothetical protein
MFGSRKAQKRAGKVLKDEKENKREEILGKCDILVH